MPKNIDEVYDKALRHAADADSDFFELAKMLAELLDRDPDLFYKMVGQSGIGERKAYYLADLARSFRGLKFNRARLKRIGWTKAHTISLGVTEANIDERMALAEANTDKNLKKLLKGEPLADDEHCVLMYFSPEQYAVLEEVLLRHGATRNNQRGMNDKEAALIKALLRVPKSRPKDPS